MKREGLNFWVGYLEKVISIGDQIMDHVIGGKFKLGRKIGSGSFGELYLGICNLYFQVAFFFLPKGLGFMGLY